MTAGSPKQLVFEQFALVGRAIGSGPRLELLTLVRALRRVAEQNLAEVARIVQRFYHARDSLEPVSRDEMRKRLRKNSVLVLDVRPLDEYTAGHVPGAVSLP